MAFNRKNWQDNVSDITAAELNRIEQGIYDNSLVADAVTNTLNPTDTETYKTAELTEGQITDVIGVSDILIKGQTSQDGEPTPNSPVDVNVVSGSNVINTNNKNLLPNNAQSITQNGVTFTVNKDKSIKINGTASANTDIYLFGGTTDTGNYLHIPQGTYSLSTPDSKFYYIAREKTQGALIGNSAILQALASNDCYFYGFFIRANQNSVFNNFVIYPQLEPGSTATTYEPHQGKELHLDLGSIELRKIGNYQDYFYKSGNDWYLHKEIEKIVLNGTESGWGVSTTNTSGYNRFANSIISSSVLAPSSNSETAKLLSNILTATSVNSNYTRNNGIALNTTGVFYIYYADISNYTIEQFKTWLASNNVTLYYVLATLTNTEITNTTLISQLESIYNAPLYEQTNITQTNNDLPMVLDITACKDNINGIKAFIRK